MTVGTWYYPKNWPREQWEADVEEMGEAGFEHARVGVFYWSRIEPRRGEFDFEWLETALDLFRNHDIDVVLGTPTGAPPKWLVDQHPDILQEDPDGTVREWGSRRHYCFNSPTYRRETERIVRRAAERFVDHPAVIGWQIDNELGAHRTTRCYCDDCSAAFRDWLAEKYADVETLNDSWGTTFWSQRHDSFDEVDALGPTPLRHHPSRLLDFYRFSSDSVLDYAEFQAELLREVNDDWTILTNFMGSFTELDAWDFADMLDLVTWNSYPTLRAQLDAEEPDGATVEELRSGDPDQVAMDHDLHRCIQNQPYWIMEQKAGDMIAYPNGPQPADGVIRLWAHHAHAHGAENVNFFRWRRCREGQEQYVGGLRRHDGSPDRGFHEAERTATDLEDIEDVDLPDARVAMLHSYDNLWALQIQPHAEKFDYWRHFRTYYGELRRRGVQVDVIPPSGDRDLSAYDAVVAPTLHLVDDGTTDWLEGYVREGGELLLTIRTGVADEFYKWFDELAPGPLGELAGVRVGQHESLPERVETRTTYRDETYEFRTWGEWLRPGDAAVDGEHSSGPAAGRPSITYNDPGAGGVTYVGVWPKPALAGAVVGDVLDRAGVETMAPLPDRVQVNERDDYVWVMNFRADPVTVDAPSDAEWVLGGHSVEGYDLAVLRGDRLDLQVSPAGSTDH